MPSVYSSTSANISNIISGWRLVSDSHCFCLACCWLVLNIFCFPFLVTVILKSSSEHYFSVPPFLGVGHTHYGVSGSGAGFAFALEFCSVTLTWPHHRHIPDKFFLSPPHPRRTQHTLPRPHTGWPQTWKTWNTPGFLWTWKTQGILCNRMEKL